MRPDLIKNEKVLRRLRAVQEECRRRPIHEARALAAAESEAFRAGRMRLEDWPEFIHAGSIAQVAPFVRVETDTNNPPQGTAQRVPDGVVKLAFVEALDTMKVDFRLLRSQLRMMERTGKLARDTQARSIGGLSPEHLRLLQEVWSVMVGMEAEVLKEFDLRHEAQCQQHGAFILESLLGPGGGECEWLQVWRDGALQAVLRPAGPQVAGQAQLSWSAAGAVGCGWPCCGRHIGRGRAARSKAEGRPPKAEGQSARGV